MLPEIWRNRGSLFAPTMDDFIEKFFYGWPSFDEKSELAWTPRLDVNETDKDIFVDVELPGIEKKDVKVELKDNVLTISGERNQEKKSENQECCRVERHYGKFERVISLPESVDSGKISAEFKNGILGLKIPKVEKAIPKAIDIEVK